MYNSAPLRYGLLGETLGHSISPFIHKRIWEASSFQNGRYDLYEISRQEMREGRRLLEQLALDGYNVTIPYKEWLLPHMDELSPEAEKIGAINTVHRTAGRYIGYNTDYYGFGLMLAKAGLTAAGKKVVILGTGGAAKAVTAYLLDQGAQTVSLVGRRPGHSTDPRLPRLTYEDLPEQRGALLINTTPVGMSPGASVSPVPASVIERFDALADLIYNPEETEFLRLGKSLKKKICGGLAMLVGQALKAQEIWLSRTWTPELFHYVYSQSQKRMKQTLFLIGMPGCGKSALGALLAEALGYSFIDMDRLIENISSRSVPELFASGEDVFRHWETQACRRLAGQSQTVIACGGGVIKEQLNREILSQSGLVIYLDRPVPHIRQDIDTSSRPLLQDGPHRLDALYEERHLLYEAAADKIIMNDRSVDHCLAQILDYYGVYLKKS